MLTSDQLVLSRYGLAPNELLWVGRPATGLRLSRSDWYSIPFSLMWCGFAIFWETMVVRGGAPFFFWLWGIPFVLIGLYAVFGRFLWDAYRRSVTWYAVTSDAAIIVREGLGGSIRRVYLPAVQSVDLSLFADGSGTIVFADARSANWHSASWGPWATTPEGNSFYRISDPRHVYDICLAAQRSK